MFSNYRNNKLETALSQLFVRDVDSLSYSETNTLMDIAAVLHTELQLHPESFTPELLAKLERVL